MFSWEHRRGKIEQLKNKISISVLHYEILCGFVAVWKYIHCSLIRNFGNTCQNQLLFRECVLLRNFKKMYRMQLPWQFFHSWQCCRLIKSNLLHILNALWWRIQTASCLRKSTIEILCKVLDFLVTQIIFPYSLCSKNPNSHIFVRGHLHCKAHYLRMVS